MGKHIVVWMNGRLPAPAGGEDTTVKEWFEEDTQGVEGEVWLPLPMGCRIKVGDMLCVVLNDHPMGMARVTRGDVENSRGWLEVCERVGLGKMAYVLDDRKLVTGGNLP